ncbi:hypothetical protein HYALB_00008907 [Hymenoscyphus albidus]|uniref:Uncharacterized protein n=1 Tax=Hymenoscyphus albidus TaxID=595503 RepID=A0A9N9LXH0_9HELO|nr:hypothetical protein HYALB_00008907 [Hymenoscyphus albidus]
MAPQGRKSLPAQPAAASDSDEETSQPSQEDLVKKAENILAQGKKRREAKRKSIEAEHSKRVKEVKTKMENLYAVRKNKVSKLQASYWERLDALNNKREALEKAILASMKTMEGHTIVVAGYISHVLDGRLEEAKEMANISESIGQTRIEGTCGIQKYPCNPC